ncbi:PGF-pre-PGF domain-containing protein [Methanosarcina hadiensis]|uniref:PGF-pre-PGF domain-containing protein n=1 Tax=Methanosarcina hadiensis TaxID=3078083 RepID=UPI0039774925
MLTCISVALCITPAPVVYVAGDGSGDFNCSGDNDHVQINEALTYVAENAEYTTVHLKGPFTYVIDDTLQISSNTILEGDSSATIKLAKNAGWSSVKPLVKEKSSGSHNITIRGFTIDGNREENTNVVSGDGYYNLIHLSDCQNISVYNMYLTNNHGDGLRADNCSSIKFYDNEAYLLGHDVLYAIICSDVVACNNTITCRTNSGLRLYNTNHASLYNNTITSRGSGGAGIEIQKDGSYFTMDDIEIYNNIIYNTALSGILVFGSGNYSNSSANVHIHHNQVYDTGTDSNSEVVGGILSEGFNGLIENNVVDGAYGCGIVQKEAYYLSHDGSGYVVTVKNNIVTNTRKSVAGAEGYGICNKLTDSHSFVTQNNSFYNNSGGNYEGVNASAWDITEDPQYADRDNHDYHLKSKVGRWNGSNWVNDNISSPCIDTGDPLSDYSNEPEPNGNRTNMGRYGNTEYASKSEFEVLNNSSEDDNDSNEEDGRGKGSKSSSSGGGTGGSPEPAKNIEVKELSQVFITNGKTIKFDFTKNATCVVHISFDSKKTAGKTTAIVEILKNKSTLTPGKLQGEVCNYLNTWVGNSGYATEKNIENATVCFKVEKEWIQNEKIEHSSITLNRYSDTTWNPLLTSLSGEDETYLYFTARTPGFSSFAITGRVIEKENVTEILPEADTQDLEQGENTESDIELKFEKAGKGVSQNEKLSMPGFEMIYCIFGLFGAFLHKKKQY